MSRCKTCGAEIKWIRTKSGKNMPVDAEKVKFVPGGKNIVVTENGETVRAKISEYGTETGYIPHWATCTDPNRHRR